jgi:hypothetical protein
MVTDKGGHSMEPWGGVKNEDFYGVFGMFLGQQLFSRSAEIPK